MARTSVIRVSVLGDATDLQRAFSNAERYTTSLGTKLTNLGRSMTQFLTIPLAGAGVAAVKLASDLVESQNKVQVVFGDSAQAVNDFVDSAGSALRMSKQEALEAAGSFGNFLTSLGLGRDAAADMSVELVQLAADLASFNNMRAEDVITALFSAMAGETEPARRLGIDLSAARVEAEALAMGLADTASELTQADKAAARFSLIMKDTTNAQGDAARTADEFAGSLAGLLADVKNVAADLGTELLPIAKDVLSSIRDLVSWFNDLPDGVQSAIVKFGLFTAAAGPVIWTVGKMITAFNALRTAILGASAAAGASGTLAGVRASATFGGLAGASGAATLAGGIAADRAGAGIGAWLRRQLGMQSGEERFGFEGGLIFSPGAKAALNRMFGWFEDDRIMAPVVEFSDAISQSAQRAFLFAEKQDYAAQVLDEAVVPAYTNVLTLADAAKQAAVTLYAFGAGQDAFNRLSDLLGSEGALLREIGITSAGSVDEVLRNRALLESQGLDTGNLLGSLNIENLILATPQTGSEFVRSMERELTRRNRETTSTVPTTSTGAVAQ